VRSVAHSIALHDTDDIWAVELPLEFEILPACTHLLLFLGLILCGESSSQRRAIGSLLFLSAPMFHCRTAESSSCRSLTLSDVPGEMTANVFAEAPICSLDSALYLQTHAVLRRHKSSQVHKFVDDFKIIFAKSHISYGVENRLSFVR
jgi:hypothetical protein